MTLRRLMWPALLLVSALVLPAMAEAQSRDPWGRPDARYNSWHRVAYDNGYREGFKEGEKDGHGRRAFDYSRDKKSQKAVHGYRREYGDRDDWYR